MKKHLVFRLFLFAMFGLCSSAEALDFPVDRQLSATADQAASESNEECLAVDKNRDLHIPCVRYRGLDYQFTLHPLINPIDPLKTIWKMDPRSLSRGSGEHCVEVGDDRRLVLPCVSFRGATSEAVLNYHENPSDAQGHYWMNEPNDRRGGATALWYPEIYVVNDFARFQAKRLDTETDTANLFNLASNLFLTSTNLIANNLQMILVGQRTITNAAEDLPHTMIGEEVDPAELLKNFAAWTETHLPQSGNTAHDAAILLTSLDLKGPVTEFTYLALMCNSSQAVAVVQATFTQAYDAASIARVIGFLVGMCNDPPGTRGPTICPALPATLDSGAACSNKVMAASRNPASEPTSFSECSAFDFNDWLVSRSPRPNCMTLPSR